MKKWKKAMLSEMYTAEELKSLSKIQKELGLSPLDMNREWKVHPCPKCDGVLRPIGLMAFACVCKCTKCGKRYRR